MVTPTDQRSELRTVLVSMPFMQVDRPSIQLGLLKAIGAAHGFPVRALHANLDFAAQLGAGDYRKLADHRDRLVGEWLFAVAAFGPAAPDRDAAFLRDFDEVEALGDLLRIRDVEVPAFLDALVDGYPWHSVRVVGFSCTFQQNTASFALARRLKERYPSIVTVFGGANFDGEMGLELVRTIPCADYAVIGEGDTAFPALLSALSQGTDPTLVPGVASSFSATRPSPPITRLDDLPSPDYTEYFARAAQLNLDLEDVWIPFESARGCWWGAKHHCTFCGLNGMTMEFRSKSPARVQAELADHARRYRSFRFEAVDNILDMKYLKDLFPALVEAGTDYSLFYEVKANLSREQMALLAKAGVTRLQPGLESLSSNVLRLMNKGIRAAQNVNLLRWAQYYDIGVSWNILWGFPGETAADYSSQALVMPHLVHLQPPTSAAQIWLERFSPLFKELTSRIPERSYGYVYPASVALERVAYFFEYSLDQVLPPDVYFGVRKSVAEWREAWRDNRPTLTYYSAPGLLRIEDTRFPGAEGTYTFEGALAEIYSACSDRPRNASAVAAKVKLPVQAVESAFAQFQERGLMFLDESQALALAIPATRGR